MKQNESGVIKQFDLRPTF